MDIGQRRIGVAVSDPLGYTAQGIETIFTRGSENDIRHIVDLAKRYKTDRILVGLPKSMDGSLGPQAQAIKEYAKQIEDVGLNVRFWDERLTSVAANRTLIEGAVSREKRKQVVDKIAAVYILQGFLDAGGWNE